jgi:hypothetical protein
MYTADSCPLTLIYADLGRFDMESIKEPCVSSHMPVRTISSTASCFQQLTVKNIWVLKLRFSVLVLSAM